MTNTVERAGRPEVTAPPPDARRLQALDQLAPLLEIPYYLSPGWLRIDPPFASLKGILATIE